MGAEECLSHTHRDLENDISRADPSCITAPITVSLEPVPSISEEADWSQIYIVWVRTTLTRHFAVREFKSRTL